MQQLQPGTTLQGGKYKIEKVLGQGGFGITYLAEQTMLGRKVAIKEFFLKEYCDRAESTSAVTFGSTGGRELTNRMRDKFVKEARNLAKLKHPNIVKVIDIFEENNTAYYIMEYCEGGSLADKVKREGYLSEPVATRYICQMASALAYLHERQMNHLDVKPANIMLNEGDEAVLIDFGLSKQYDDAGNQTSTTPVGISEGYAPMEQYKQGGVQEFSPETDIYALGATFYKLLTGITPPSASDVNEDGLPVDLLKAKAVSEKAIAVICRAMESRKKDRTKDVRDFSEKLRTTGESGIAHSRIVSNSEVPSPHTADDATVTFNQIQIQPTVKGGGTKMQFDSSTKDSHIRTTVKKPRQKKRKRLWSWVLFSIMGIILLFIVLFMIGLNSINEEEKQWEEDFETELEERKANPSYYKDLEQDISSRSFIVKDQVAFEMMKVEAGTFTMGGSDEMTKAIQEYADSAVLDTDDYTDVPLEELPAFSVQLPHNFYISKNEVTQMLWWVVMGTNPSSSQGDEKPVDQVSWNDCQKFIKKLNQLTGQNFRLPTEAEWEYAARGGKNSQHTAYSGSSNIHKVAWFKGNSNGKMADVQLLEANELGICDMSGGVAEWVEDAYSEYCDEYDNPSHPTDYHVVRGGWFGSCALDCRVSCRRALPPSNKSRGVGFRLVLSE